MPGQDLSNADFQLALQFVNQTSRSVFLTGKAGTGKTTFLKFIRDHSRKKMVVLAPTGVAAMNAGGVTMHSFFQLPFAPFIPGHWPFPDASGNFATEQSLLKNIRFSAAKKDLLQELELLIIDEVSMLRADMLDAMDLILRHFRNSPAPFGGLQVLFIGDLYQLPPVVNKSDWEMLGAHYQSPFFFDARVLRNNPLVFITLNTIYRQQDIFFIDLLNSIRNNTVTEEELDRFNERHDPHFQPAYGEQFITLTTHNARADAINKNQLQQLRGADYAFRAELTGDFDPRTLIAEQELVLKKGAQVMFIKNDKGENRRYYNGKIGVVSAISFDEISVQFPDEPEELKVEKETWKNIRYHYNQEQGTVEEETVGSFTQYPIRLAWAITIHKSQGLTFERAIIDAGASFAPGQVYVALSRLTSLQGLVLHSRIYAGSIRTDQQVAAFSQTAAASSDDLRERLREEQAAYVLQLIERAFRWDKLLTAFRNHQESYGAGLASGMDAAAVWAKDMLAKIEAENQVSGKFGHQLTLLLSAAKTEGYGIMQPRIEAACGYFLNALEQLTGRVGKRKSESKMLKGAKKYLKELAGLERILLVKKQELLQAERMGKGLAEGSDLYVLFDPVQPKAEEEKKPPDAVANKLKKGQTQRMSLDLFREKKTIQEIAKIRSLAQTTIETHLAGFVASGEIDIEDLVPREKIQPVLQAIREAGAEFLSPIKSRLGDHYSYLEIKAVVQYYLKQNQASGKTGEPV